MLEKIQSSKPVCVKCIGWCRSGIFYQALDSVRIMLDRLPRNLKIHKLQNVRLNTVIIRIIPEAPASPLLIRVVHVRAGICKPQNVRDSSIQALVGAVEVWVGRDEDSRMPTEEAETSCVVIGDGNRTITQVGFREYWKEEKKNQTRYFKSESSDFDSVNLAYLRWIASNGALVAVFF